MSNRRFAFPLALTLVAAGCTSHTLEAPIVQPTGTLSNVQTYHQNNKLDLLCMSDDSSSMRTMQQKLREQLQNFMNVLQDTPNGLPDIHIGVVSSDMGAPSDTQIYDCT